MERQDKTPGTVTGQDVYDEAETCKLSELDVGVLACCRERGVVSPVEKDGQRFYTSQDLLKLKLLRTLLLSRRLSAALDTAFLKIGRKLLPQHTSTPAGHSSQLLDTIEQLLKR